MADLRDPAPPSLVVGSYPPVQTASTGPTVEAVRRCWAAGEEVVVASPRPSAAHRITRVDGALGGVHLRALQRETGARRLVLAAEPGMPVHARSTDEGRLDSWLTCAGLAWALRQFDDVTLIEAGMEERRPAGWRLVRRAATRRQATAGRGTPGVEPVLPAGSAVAARRAIAAIAARRLGRRVLGRHAPLVGRVARRAVAVGRRLR